MLLSYPVLRNVSFSLPITLQVDVSDVGVGAVLSQSDETSCGIFQQKVAAKGTEVFSH